MDNSNTTPKFQVKLPKDRTIPVELQSEILYILFGIKSKNPAVIVDTIMNFKPQKAKEGV